MMLDLFSGTGSVAAVFRRAGFTVTTLDMDAHAKPDIVADIMQWDYTSISPKNFHTILAAPPCTEYSQALTSRPRNMEKADAIVRCTLAIIDSFKPVCWYLENAHTGHLKEHGILDTHPSIRSDYCQFAPWGYHKPTRVWGTVAGLEDVVCDKKVCPNVTLQTDPEWETVTRRHRVRL